MGKLKKAIVTQENWAGLVTGELNIAKAAI